ncbi:serine/threonine-protein kinase [Streptomyces sp. V3I7]|uniref:serine/threonine-protein kinase n=1 Tax=Streptomyces sp. V3I7 TaxID=3042278 RepID=UPI0027D869B5|nr:serine/threonine-protein kinase [Streptomyces sp. V3I7]
MQGLLIAGRYRLVDSIGSGGMGRVWRAHDEVLHRAVAVKELTAALYASEDDQGMLLARTRAEARAAARINHSAVVTVHDVLEHDGRPWIVMELVEGNSLADAVKEKGRVESREAARIGLWVLRALRAAHAAGVLHRDVKPGNVLLGRDGRVLLTDFGIAQIEGDTTITRTGEVVGSVDYLAPERVRGHDPGPASDLWALGATLYTAVEGRSPFRRTSPLSTMQAVVEEEAETPQHAGALGPVITALLRKDPAQRPDAARTELMLAEAAEGRRSSTAQAYVPTQQVGPRPGERSAAEGGHAGPGAAHGPAYGQGAPAYRPEAATPAVPAQFADLAAAPRRSRRARLRKLAAVVAVSAIVGGGAAVASQMLDLGRWGVGAQASPSPSVSQSASDTVSSPSEPSGTVPDSWVPRSDPMGFRLSLPKGWKRSVYGVQGDLKQVDYTPDGGKHLVRIAIDGSPDFASPLQHQQDLEQQLHRLVDYRRVAMEENTYRDRKGSLWENTWTALRKDPPYVAGPYHAIEQSYVSREGVEYVIYMASPAQDWAQTSRQFRWVLQSWQPDAG